MGTHKCLSKPEPVQSILCIQTFVLCSSPWHPSAPGQAVTQCQSSRPPHSQLQEQLWGGGSAPCRVSRAPLGTASSSTSPSSREFGRLHCPPASPGVCSPWASVCDCPTNKEMQVLPLLHPLYLDCQGSHFTSSSLVLEAGSQPAQDRDSGVWTQPTQKYVLTLSAAQWKTRPAGAQHSDFK